MGSGGFLRPKAKVLATEISGQDTAAELAALKASTKGQDAKIKVLSAQLRGDTSGAKRACNGVPVEKKPIPVCTVCSKRGHNAVDCWDKLDADQAKLDLDKAARDKKKADMSKCLALGHVRLLLVASRGHGAWTCPPSSCREPRTCKETKA
jgi:hypothetical protein